MKDPGLPCRLARTWKLAVPTYSGQFSSMNEASNKGYGLKFFDTETTSQMDGRGAEELCASKIGRSAFR
jgi:hypothetical protein